MQKHVFAFAGQRIELWTHAAPDYLASVISRTHTFYELDVLAKCRELHLPNTAIIDVGANIGNHTVFFAAVIGAPVVAFEPDPRSYRLLELSIAANSLAGRVTAHRIALGAADGRGTLQAGPHSGTARVSFEGGDIPVGRLDGMAISEPVGLIKVDVEGAEVAVFEGATELIRRWLPDIIVEVEHGHEFPPVVRVLLDLGYTPRGRYAATPTYLFSAIDQARRMRALLQVW